MSVTNAQRDLPVLERGTGASRAAQLAFHEATIERSHQAARDALYAIYSEKLYLETHSTFEDYCEQRWNFTRQRGYQIVDEAKIAISLSNAFDTTAIPGRHLAPLKQVPDELRVKVWEIATETAPPSGMTSWHVAHTRDRVLDALPMPTCDEPGCARPLWAKGKCSTHQLRKHADSHVKRRIASDAGLEHHTLILIEKYRPYAEVIRGWKLHGRDAGHHAVVGFDAEMDTYAQLCDEQGVRLIYHELDITYYPLED